MSSRQPLLLCIDDDPQTLDVRRMLLENQGFSVLTAGGGREGLEKFQAHRVDAVICDYQMPEMDGGQVAQAIKHARPKVPVMILSALPFLPEDAPDCIDAFVTKGEPTAFLVAKINQMMGAPAVPKPPSSWMPNFGFSQGETARPRRTRRGFGHHALGFNGS